MRMTLMWSVNDLPAYGMTFGWSTAGILGRPICMDDIRALSAARNKKAFTKNRRNKVAHLRLTGDQILNWVANISPAVEMPLYLPDGYGSNCNWTKKSSFSDPPYLSTLLIRYNLDVMHIEKNIFDNIFNIIMDIKENTKDNINACRDLKIICNHCELELDERRPNVMPKAVYTLGKEQKKRVCE
ncbi:UNVERIFIED_CONTAM: hypothetical protein Sangu_1448900 [Sesamum angustifolium]|uniref:Uncharacterized protein n=1 Tax=Sesamum angustifolium TaxID=2727405 RepID=A0AAW2N820_9LAMI